MRFPKLRVTEQTREFIQEFGGLDRRPRIPENCFSDMRNLTSDQYPALAPREKRGVVGKIENCNALIARDKLAYVKGNTLYYGEGDDAVTMELSAGEDVQRQLVSMGAYIVVFPDHMYLNTADTNDRGTPRTTISSDEMGGLVFSTYLRTNDALVQPEENLISCFDVSSGECPINGETIKIHFSEASYAFAGDGTIQTMDLEGVPNPFRFKDYEVELRFGSGEGSKFELVESEDLYANVKWSGGDGHWTMKVRNEQIGLSVEHHLIRAGTTGKSIGPHGKYKITYDDLLQKTVFLNNSGEVVNTVLRIQSQCLSEYPEGERSNVIITPKVDGTALPYLSGLPANCETAYHQGDSLWVAGSLHIAPSLTTSLNNAISIEFNSVFPKMDYIIESQNRLWGCRYGESNKGELVNEIYASALGSFGNWYTHNTVSTDSYEASVGTDGPFTGAVNYRGYPLFFKENVMYKIYGDYPENYQIVSDTSMGVQQGCDKSLCVLSNMLYYKSSDGIFAYDGSSVARIDAALAREYYRDVVCGGLGSKLWFSMEGEDPAHNGIYVYDTDKGVWHKEDEREARYFARYNNNLYCVDASNDLFTVRGTDGELEADDVNFFAETGVIGYSTPDSKYVSRLALRLLIPHDGRLNIYIDYDSANVWEFKGCIEGNGLGTFTIPIVPRNCDHFRIRFEGRGACRIFGFSKVMEEGGAV